MKLLIASNRLPVTIARSDGSYQVTRSVGGLATSLADLVAERQMATEWLGWPGEDIPARDRKGVTELLRDQHAGIPVFLPAKLINNFYDGFCNKTLWPLFHYFPSRCLFKQTYWEAYREANRHFAAKIIERYQPGDTVFIQDYHLMLVPALVRAKLADAKIAFFLHIPFPHMEVFRTLPSGWRLEILRGLLGADLVGFHTEEYTQYFLHNVFSLLGFENHFGVIKYEERLVKAQTAPLGIDFEEYFRAHEDKAVKRERKELRQQLGKQKVILSIDRLDYTKGITNRLEGYRSFLRHHPQHHGKVTLLMVTVPSRTSIGAYQTMKRKIEELVSGINGEFGTLEWIPIRYQYKAFHGAELKALYGVADVMLVTPLRDGMNLVAKEYVASRERGDGVLVLSEFAGAGRELREAMFVNPNLPLEIGETIAASLELTEKQQWLRMKQMQQRLRERTVRDWFEQIIANVVVHREVHRPAVDLGDAPEAVVGLVGAYRKAKKRLLLLDYDGTLVPFAPTPMDATPTAESLELLKQLTADPNNNVVVISGRDKKTMEDWLSLPGVNFIAEHGAFTRRYGDEWRAAPMDIDSWKPFVEPIIEKHAKKIARSLIEEKEASVAWHFRMADKREVAAVRAELMDELLPLVANSNVQIVWGEEAVEVKNAGVTKGFAIRELIDDGDYDFILAAGDDVTDEDMFVALDRSAYRIKVGNQPSEADYRVADSEAFTQLLQRLLQRS
jgi:trehalose 6-phosphate synthase/phosphatase